MLGESVSQALRATRNTGTSTLLLILFLRTRWSKWVSVVADRRNNTWMDVPSLLMFFPSRLALFPLLPGTKPIGSMLHYTTREWRHVSAYLFLGNLPSNMLWDGAACCSWQEETLVTLAAKGAGNRCDLLFPLTCYLYFINVNRNGICVVSSAFQLHELQHFLREFFRLAQIQHCPLSRETNPLFSIRKLWRNICTLWYVRPRAIQGINLIGALWGCRCRSLVFLPHIWQLLNSPPAPPSLSLPLPLSAPSLSLSLSLAWWVVVHAT